MAKIIIIAPKDAEDVDDAVKLLKGAGHDVDVEEPNPKTLLHVIMGLFSPNAFGFGSAYAVGSKAAPPSDDKADKKDAAPKGDDVTVTADDKADKKDDKKKDDVVETDDDDFNFESLGNATVDGELIEAVSAKTDKSFLSVPDLQTGAKVTYKINESLVSFWPENPNDITQKTSVRNGNKSATLNLAIKASTENKATLYVGSDLIDLFKN